MNDDDLIERMAEAMLSTYSGEFTAKPSLGSMVALARAALAVVEAEPLCICGHNREAHIHDDEGHDWCGRSGHPGCYLDDGEVSDFDGAEHKFTPVGRHHFEPATAQPFAETEKLEPVPQSVAEAREAYLRAMGFNASTQRIVTEEEQRAFHALIEAVRHERDSKVGQA